MCEFLNNITKELDEIFRVEESKEQYNYLEGSLIYGNGLLIESSQEINVIVGSVFPSKYVFNRISNELQFSNGVLWIVHHLFYIDLVDEKYAALSLNMIEEMKKRKISLYVIHAPLDTHRTLGHGIQLAESLLMEKVGNFGSYNNQYIGIIVELNIKLQEIMEKVYNIVPFKTTVKATIFRNTRIKRLGIIPGLLCLPELLIEAYKNRIDILLTGTMEDDSGYEPFKKRTKVIQKMVDKCEMNIIQLGHYNSERFGIIAILSYLKKYELNIKFLEDMHQYI